MKKLSCTPYKMKTFVFESTPQDDSNSNKYYLDPNDKNFEEVVSWDPMSELINLHLANKKDSIIYQIGEKGCLGNWQATKPPKVLEIEMEKKNGETIYFGIDAKTIYNRIDFGIVFVFRDNLPLKEFFENKLLTKQPCICMDEWKGMEKISAVLSNCLHEFKLAKFTAALTVNHDFDFVLYFNLQSCE